MIKGGVGKMKEVPLINAGGSVLKKLMEVGHQAYFVGGMVRDQLLGFEVKDVDIATSATPDEIKGIFEQVYETGVAHGTVTVVRNGFNIEVTTFRIETGYSDGRRPDEVMFTTSLEADLSRRDFTINGMAQTLDGTIIDPFNGRMDLETRLIRAIGNPTARFEEDALRILRGVRFVAKLGFDIEAKTLKAMKGCRPLLARLSFERIRGELTGMIEGKYRKKAMGIMFEYGLFKEIPFFKEIHHIDGLHLFNTIASFLAFVAFEVNDRALFLSAFPFRKEEKRWIKQLEVAHRFRVVDRMRLTQYYFGLQTANILHQLNAFYAKSDEPFQAVSLPIQCRQDLAFQPEVAIQLFEREPGPWMGKCFTEIERLVLSGALENTDGAIRAYLEGVMDHE